MIDTPSALNRWNMEHGPDYTYKTINPTAIIESKNSTIYNNAIKNAYQGKELRIDDVKEVSLLELPPVK